MFMIINGIIIIIVRVLIVFENIVREPKHLANIVKSNLSHHAKTIGSQYYIVYVRIDCDEFFFFSIDTEVSSSTQIDGRHDTSFGELHTSTNSPPVLETPERC